MRAIVCADHGCELRKLIWVTENRTGVSAGICEPDANPHATYHVDGMYHHKLNQKGEELTIFPEKKVPLESIFPKQHLLGTCTFFVGDTMNLLAPFKPDGRADSIVVLNQSFFSNIRCASFTSYILHRDHETDFLREAFASYECDNFTLVLINTLPLEYFRSHKVGLIVYKGREGPFADSGPRQASLTSAPSRSLP